MAQVQRGLVRLVNASRLRINEQIKLEEALFRATSSGSWCILNHCEMQDPTIVMGISGKPNELLNVQRVKEDNIPVLRRFTGGGTVIVNQDTQFVSFIVDSNSLLPTVRVFPREIMRWTEAFYLPVFQGLCGPDCGFHLEDTDYVFDDVKFGGNAQGISGKRWVHHTSFLWDYDTAQMGYLSNPAKQPEYRKRRSHDEFLCRVKDKVQSEAVPDDFFHAVEWNLKQQFSVEKVDLDAALEYVNLPHRKKTEWVEIR